MGNKKNNIGEILDKEIHEFYNQIDLSKTETKIIKNEELEEKTSSKKERAKGLLKLIPSIAGGISGYTLFRYGFGYELVQSIGMGVMGALNGAFLYGIYHSIKHDKKN